MKGTSTMLALLVIKEKYASVSSQILVQCYCITHAFCLSLLAMIIYPNQLWVHKLVSLYCPKP